MTYGSVVPLSISGNVRQFETVQTMGSGRTHEYHLHTVGVKIMATEYAVNTNGVY